MKSRGRRSGKQNISGDRNPTATRVDVFRGSVERNISITTPAQRFIACARQFLGDEYLPKIERCLERLTDEQIWWRANEESNSIGNLVLHLCGNARQWIVCGVGGASDARDRDAEFAQREQIERSELLKLLRATIADVDSTLEKVDPATLLEQRSIQGSNVDVLEAIFHVTEHFSMHTGQIVMLTKMLTSGDLHFYDFSSGSSAHGWHSPLVK